MKRILVVDDDLDVITAAQIVLGGKGFEVTGALSALLALDEISRSGLPDLAIIDIWMPGMDGIEMARRLLNYLDLPIILLTAADERDVVSAAIDEVAVDRIAKPFSSELLVARVQRAALRMGDFAFPLEPLAVIDERLSIDFAGRKALIDGEPVSLTPAENKLLYILVRFARRAVTAEYLLERLWPLEAVFEHSLDFNIRRLRHKLEPEKSAPRYLISHRGIGFSFLPVTAPTLRPLEGQGRRLTP